MIGVCPALSVSAAVAWPSAMSGWAPGTGPSGTLTSDAAILTVFCAGDANRDGVVDPLDTGFVQARFGCDYPGDGEFCLQADVNEDGVVDPLDVGFILARFGECS